MSTSRPHTGASQCIKASGGRVPGSVAEAFPCIVTVPEVALEVSPPAPRYTHPLLRGQDPWRAM